MPRISPYQIVLTDAERTELESIARKYTLPYFQVVRAKIVLLAAEGWENKQIAQRLGIRREIACKWRKRFFEKRLPGLEEEPRIGRPPAFSPSGRRSRQGSGL